MSYSRWSNSCWYTYWAIGDDNDPKEAQVFQVCMEGWWTYAQLRENIEACLDDVRQGRTEEQIEELRGYIERFLSDVDASYPEVTDVKKET